MRAASPERLADGVGEAEAYEIIREAGEAIRAMEAGRDELLAVMGR